MATTRPSSEPRRGWTARLGGVIVEMALRPSGLVGLLLVCGQILLAVISPSIVPYDFTTQNLQFVLANPSAEHWLGGDHLGRDVLTRTMLGGRQALVITSVGTLLAVFWGGSLGLVLGILGGRIDDVVMRVVDAFLAIPWIVFLLLIIAMLGTDDIVLIPTLGFFYGISVTRIARAATHDVVARDFITAARARGESTWTIAWREVLPNVRDVLLVEGAMRWSWMLLAFSSLSFLGFGITPPTPDWGLMIADGRSYMSVAPWAVLGPVIALSSMIIGVNLSADALAKTLGIDRAQKAPV
jgi:peptide/nickel transport system permease protein